jgi:hypothetical protein
VGVPEGAIACRATRRKGEWPRKKTGSERTILTLLNRRHPVKRRRLFVRSERCQVVSRDTPRPERSTRERGTYAQHGGDPTLASYLSSLLFLLSVPGCIVLAYGGYWAGLYPYAGIVPAFGLCLASIIIVAFAAMATRN